MLASYAWECRAGIFFRQVVIAGARSERRIGPGSEATPATASQLKAAGSSQGRDALDESLKLPAVPQSQPWRQHLYWRNHHPRAAEQWDATGDKQHELHYTQVR